MWRSMVKRSPERMKFAGSNPATKTADKRRREMKYRKKPVVIEAVEWTGDNLREIIDFSGLHPSAKKWSWEEYEAVVEKEGLKIFTLESQAFLCSIGDFIIKGVKGEFYACRNDIFLETYEKVD